MNAPQLGNLAAMPLNSLWKHEATEFTPWLCEHIDYLNEVLGFNIVTDETEHTLDNFRIDIVGHIDSDEDTKVVIENQFGSSNHDHLGKLISYMSTYGAKIAVWIVEDAREEHINAVKFLNSVCGDDYQFYLLKAELLRIDNSNPALILTKLVESDASVIGESGEKHPTLVFWEEFVERCKARKYHTFAKISPKKMHWLDAGCGRNGMHYCVSVKKHQTCIQFVFGHSQQFVNKANFSRFEAFKDEIHRIYGEPLEWREMKENKSSMICATYDWGGTMSEREQRAVAIEKTIDAMVRFEGAFKEILKRL